MNVAMVTSTGFPPEEGIGYYTYNLARELIEHGHTVAVITRGRGLTSTKTGEFDGIKLIEVPFYPVYPIHVDVHGVFVNRVVDALADQLDLVHVHAPLTPVIDTPLPVVSTIHSSIVNGVGELDGGLRTLPVRLTAKVTTRRIITAQSARAERITTVANSVAEELDRHYGLTDVDVVGNGVDTDRFYPPDDGDDDREPYVLFVGRLANFKGVEDLLDAAERFLDGNDVRLKLAGKGPRGDEYRKRADRLGIADSVDFLGHLSHEELVELYQHASVFTLPSHYEGLPTVLLEAMACGCPPVATAISGCLDVIEDDVNGLLVPPRDPVELADAVSGLLADPATGDRLGTAALETVRESYTWEAIGERYEAIYHDVVAG